MNLLRSFRLDTRFGDKPNLQWIGNRHARDMRTQDVDDGHRIAGRFEYHVIGGTQLLRKALQFIASQPGAAAGMQRAILQACDLGLFRPAAVSVRAGYVDTPAVSDLRPLGLFPCSLRSMNSESSPILLLPFIHHNTTSVHGGCA